MIKKFNSFFSFINREKKIHSICKEYNITNYTINDDLSVNVNGEVNLVNRNLSKLPLKFGEVNGDFKCGINNLTTLEGVPTKINGCFNCYHNKLTSLEGLPDIIDGEICCEENQITSFKGVPEYFNSYFICIENPIHAIFKLFNPGKYDEDIKFIYWINEYDVIQGNNIILDRLEEVFIQIGMDIPKIDFVKGYNLI